MYCVFWQRIIVQAGVPIDHGIFCLYDPHGRRSNLLVSFCTLGSKC